jgi:hypothetical protein
LLAGKTPFTGDTTMAVMVQHLNGTAPRLDKVNSAITPQVAAIVATCLARNPEDRYPDMNALIEALDHPENADISILEKLSASSAPAPSLENMQTLKGVLIAIAIMGVLVLLALGLQYLNH